MALQCQAFPTAFRRLDLRQAPRGFFKIKPQRRGTAKHGQGIIDEMLARCAKIKNKALTTDRCRDGGMIGKERDIQPTNIGLGMHAERQKTSCGRPRRMGLQTVVMAVVSRQKRHPALAKPAIDLRLFIRNRFFGWKVFDMDFFNRGHQRDMRLDLMGQRPDFTGVIGADFINPVLALKRHPRQGQRHTQMIVIGGG